MPLILDNFRWKANVVVAQPIIAIEVEPDLWLIAGGTFRLKQMTPIEDLPKIEKILGKFDIRLCCHVKKGSLPDDLLKIVDFVVPFVPGQTSLDEKYYTEG